MSKIKWIKISTEMFADEKIELIEKMPEGNAVLIIWIKLLTMAGRQNAGGFIFLTEEIGYTPEMLSTVLKKPLAVIRMALGILKDFKMISFMKDGTIAITNWDKHQNIEGMERIRRLGKNRQRKFRESKKLSTGNVTVTKCNDTDKNRLDKKKNKDSIPFTQIIDYLNKRAQKRFKATATTKAKIRARWKDGFRLEDFEKVINIKCSHWMPENGKPTEVDGQDMRDYLRPDTLFCSKFEGYLNQSEKRKISQEIIEREAKHEIAKQEWDVKDYVRTPIPEDVKKKMEEIKRRAIAK